MRGMGSLTQSQFHMVVIIRLGFTQSQFKIGQHLVINNRSNLLTGLRLNVLLSAIPTV